MGLIRTAIPTGLCGIVGLKPTYGRASRYGLIAYASSLDQIGPFATDVAGASLLLKAISGHDPRDSTSVQQAVPQYSKTFDQPLAGLRIGVPVEQFAEGLDAEVERSVREALAVYRSLGAEIKDVHLPHSKYAMSANLAGLPGVSIPCGLSSQQLPIGLQLLAPPFEEERMLRAARMFERETDWNLRRPERR